MPSWIPIAALARRSRAASRPAVVSALAVASFALGPLPFAPAARADTVRLPLIDLAPGQDYYGFQGGLYPGGSNAVPSSHHDAGLLQAASVVPRDTAGNPTSANAGGVIVLLSIGMSNTIAEYAAFQATAQNDWHLNPAVRVLNGAYPSQVALAWDSPTESNYDRVRDTVLAPAGCSQEQVQAVWLKVANATPTVSLASGSANADAYALETNIGNVLRALRIRYPNLRQVFLSSRTYGGYATSPLNPEPYAYESGFSVKWTIGAQIDQIATGSVDPRAGSLSYAGSSAVAPWVAWGPYLWASGTTPNGQGLSWVQSDFDPGDGTHPANTGRQKVADALLGFFLQSPYTAWFRNPDAVPPPSTSITLTTVGGPNNFQWTAASGVGNPSGFMILFSKSIALPTYPPGVGVGGFARSYASGPPWTAWITGNDGSGVYHVRVCAIGSSTTCSAYSNLLNVTLTSPTDTVAPVISSLQTSGVSAAGATVAWTTNEAATSSVQYGLTAAYGSTASDATLLTSHAVALSGLTANSLYHYRVCSSDAASNQACSSDATFTTAAPSATITLTRVGTTNQFQWTATGGAGNPDGFRFVASKTVNPPVYPGTPPTTGYLSIAYGSGGPWSTWMSAFNGTGTYHVRVCAYQAATNTCSLYSNMLDITY